MDTPNRITRLIRVLTQRVITPTLFNCGSEIPAEGRVTLVLYISVDCEPGYYRNDMMTQCNQCRANSYSAAGATDCIDCEEGQLVNTERTSCGKYCNSE